MPNLLPWFLSAQRRSSFSVVVVVAIKIVPAIIARTFFLDNAKNVKSFLEPRNPRDFFFQNREKVLAVTLFFLRKLVRKLSQLDRLELVADPILSLKRYNQNLSLMKKYITLAALLAAGTACAHAANDLNISSGGNFWGGDFTFGFTVTEDALSATDTTDVLALYWGTYSSSNYYSNGFTLTYTGDGIQLYVGDGAMAEVGASADVAEITEATTFTGARGATFTTLLTVGESYVIKNVGGNGGQSVSLVAAAWDNTKNAYVIEKDATALETVTYNGNMNGGDANTTMGSLVNSDYNASANVVVIPEPSAFGMLAGLGALALVAARRRRR